MFSTETLLAMASFSQDVHLLSADLRVAVNVRESYHTPHATARVEALADEWTRAYRNAFGHPFEPIHSPNYQALLEVAVSLVERLKPNCTDRQTLALVDAFLEAAQKTLPAAPVDS